MSNGKVALITGSVGGIGYATAQALAADGYDIMLNGFAEPGLVAERSDKLRADHAIRVDYHGADLRQVSAMEDLVAQTVARLGSVDVLVNNAAVRHFGAVDVFRTEDWDESIAVNLSAPFHMTRLVLPHMKAKNWGRIINISSVFGFFAAKERIDYITTKTALLGMTRAVALECAKTGITCNAICPGTTLTQPIDNRIVKLMADEDLSREAAILKFMEHRSPSGRFVSEHNIAALIAFLCGPYSADFNGAGLPIDAGWLSGR